MISAEFKAKCFNAKCQLKIALKYTFRKLRYVLIQRDKDAELDTYDEIGMMYYKMNQIERAKFFHDKCIDLVHEPEDSSLRVNNLFINKEKLNKKARLATKRGDKKKHGDGEFFEEQDPLVFCESDDSEDDFTKGMFGDIEGTSSKSRMPEFQ